MEVWIVRSHTPRGDRALPAVGREVELGGDGAQLRRCEGEQLAAGRRVLGRHCATFASSRSWGAVIALGSIVQ